jgi:hypothetical protein
MCCEQRSVVDYTLQLSANFGTFSDVRMFLAFMTLLSLAATTPGQEQEGKLVDRLLRPNMSLVNSSQDKQFAARNVALEKRAATKNFYAPERWAEKSFAGERALSPQQFAVRHFRTGDSSANISTRSQLTKTDTVYVVPSAQAPRAAPENGRIVATDSFPGNRPFLGQGKSQKALSAHDRPLTIEQVRELLNKNK